MSSEKGWRGGEQQLAYLLGDLSSSDVDNVLAVRPGSRLEEFSNEKRIPSYSIKYSNSLDVVSAYNINRICKKERIDLIHLHSSKAQGVAVLSTLYGNHVPMVLSRRVAFAPGKNLFSIWKYNQKQIKRILCVSDKIRMIMQSYVKDASKCVTVYSGIDLRKFANLRPDRAFLVKEFNLQPDKTIAVAIGAIDESKDHYTFVDTIAHLVSEGFAVQGLIIGDGPLASSVRRHAVHRGVDSHVRFAGNRSDVGQLLVSADLFLMTSREEGLGTSILDAFLAGIPVVATDAGGIPEMVRNEETGFTAPVGDALKLSKQVIRLLVDGGLRQRLVDRASVFVKNFSKEETSSKTLKIYKEVLTK